MFTLEVGQELEFIEATRSDGREIAKGTRVRVGAIVPTLVESKVTLIIHRGMSPEALTVDRHIVTLHCRTL